MYYNFLQFDWLISLSDVMYVSTFRKVEQVAEESDSLKESLDKYFLRHQKRMMEAKERAELLGRAVCSLSFFHLMY